MSQKLEAQGGKGGSQWDDGADHDGVRKIHIRIGRKGVQYIKFDYDKSGQLKEGSFHGLNDGKPAQTFEINHPDEYLVSIEGYYDDVGIIQALQFTTNKKTSGLIGYDDGTKFSLEVEGKKIVGFHGYADTTLNSLGAYFASSSSSPADKLEAQGGKGGTTFDDGVFDGVRKVYVGQGDLGVAYVKFEYEKGGNPDTRDHGKRTMLGTEEFELEYPNEYITSVEGSYDKVFGSNSEIITSLTFKTSKGRTSQPFGIVAGTPFVLNGNGGKLLGFHGQASDVVHALGAYFAKSSTPLTPPNKLEAQGGKGGTTFDDGTFDGVRKVYVGQGDIGVAYVKFEYEKSGNSDTRDHGKRTMLGTEEFELEYPDEYITSVEGTYDKVFGSESEIVTSLTFKTSKGRTSQPFGIVAGTPFVLNGNGGKLLGFHGQASDVLHALGAYFGKPSTPLTPTKKLQAKGGDGGNPWDDGVYDGVKKVLVGQGDIGVSFVKFEYANGTQTVVGDDRGKKSLLGTEEFEVDHPSEYITSVEGTFDKIFGSEAEVITMLKFKTNKKTSPPYGVEAGEKFVFEEQGQKIVGFHGKAGEVIHQVGVHVAPISN